MFEFFFNLFYSLFQGVWDDRYFTNFSANFKNIFSEFSLWLSTVWSQQGGYQFGLYLEDVLGIVSMVCALVVVVGLAFLVVTLIKKVFNVFFLFGR